MDNSEFDEGVPVAADDDRLTSVRYSPKPVAVGAAWVGVALALGWIVLTDDVVGRTLGIAGALLLAVLALIGTLVRPRLAADVEGLSVGGLRGARRWPWRDVLRVEVVAARRIGSGVGVLEIDVLDDDGTDSLVVLTRLDLGADPYTVAAELDDLRLRP